MIETIKNKTNWSISQIYQKLMLGVLDINSYITDDSQKLKLYRYELSPSSTMEFTNPGYMYEGQVLELIDGEDVISCEIISIINNIVKIDKIIDTSKVYKYFEVNYQETQLPLDTMLINDTILKEILLTYCLINYNKINYDGVKSYKEGDIEESFFDQKDIAKQYGFDYKNMINKYILNGVGIINLTIK